MQDTAGLLALGDSITYGEGDVALGVDARSWALWLAMALDLPYVNYAVPGAVVDDVVSWQLPRVRGGFALGCVYIGVNDVRSPGFVLDAYARGLETVLAAVAPVCGTLLVATIPLDLGRPRAGAKVADANAAIRAAAGRHGAVVLALDDLRGWRLLLPDAVHPTALGQLELADRAAAALGTGLVPSRLAAPDRSRGGLVRYGRSWAWQWGLEARRRRAAARS